MKAASAHTPLFTVAEVETSTANGLQTKVYMHSLHTDQRLCKQVEIKLRHFAAFCMKLLSHLFLL